jgi:hypothetical protein
MENSVQPKKRTDDEVQAFYAMFVLLICVECSKEPEFSCENCDKVYKQEGRYHAHIAKCAVKDTGWGGGGGGGGGSGCGSGSGAGGCGDTGGCISIKSSEFDELLRQNREMLALLQKQQETIQTLVSQLVK